MKKFMRYVIEIEDEEFMNALPKKKQKLNHNLLINIISQEKMIATAELLVNHAVKYELTETTKIWNLSGFIMLVSIDLKTIMLGLINSENEWQRRFYMRQCCLIMYESIKDIFQLLGSDFKSLLKNYIQEEQIENKFSIIRRALGEFEKDNEQTLKSIRNATAAHKDHDIRTQIEHIRYLSITKNLSMMTTFDEILNELGKIVQIVIDTDIRKVKSK